MSAQIHHLAGQSAEDAAWDAYQRHKVKELTDPRLATDRQHMETSTRLHEEWKRLFLANQRSADVVPIDGGRK